MAGIPFIGENGFYPSWAKRSGQWLFQRTLVSLGGMMAGYAELAAQNVPTAGQIIVWVPPNRGLLGWFSSSAIHTERQNALRQLSQFRFLCYGNECHLKPESPSAVQKFVRENGLRPEEWALMCPNCGGTVGPDLSPINADSILRKWAQSGKFPLDNPGASAAFKSVPTIADLPSWIQENDPSHLELAYLGQQMWPSIHAMFKELSYA